MKAVVLLSGGMDSCVAMAQARDDGADELIAVSVLYGSKHGEAELMAAARVAGWFGAEWKEVVFPDVFSGAGSALMGESTMPHLTYQEIDAQKGPSPTVVPFRNANFLSLATAIAITHKASHVYAGMHGEDAHNFAYPDCTPEFLGAMANAIYVGSYHEVRLQFPLIWMSKADVCKRGLQLEAPFHLTWSCYDPRDYGSAMPSTERWLQCGKCPTCVERIEAFRKNGIIDPVPYFGTTIDWADCIPFMIGGSYVQR
jgi:7-cyano-7-deazaguanine synthase